MFPVLQGAIGLLLFDPQGDHREPIMVQGTTYKRQSGPCTGVLELKEEAANQGQVFPWGFPSQ